MPAAFPSREAAAAPATPMRRYFIKTTSSTMFTPLAATTEPMASLERSSRMAKLERTRLTPTKGDESRVKKA